MPHWNWIRLSESKFSDELSSNYLGVSICTPLDVKPWCTHADLHGHTNVSDSRYLQCVCFTQIESTYIYIYIYINIFKRYLQHLFIIYIYLYIYIFVSKNPSAYISITTIYSRTYPLNHRGWVVLFGHCWRHFAAIVSYLHWNLLRWRPWEYYDGLENTFWGFHSLQGSLPRKGRQSCTCVYLYLYLYLHTGIAKLKHDSLSFCNCTRTERYAHTCPEPYR